MKCKCTRCDGSGQIVNPLICPDCEGAGKVEVEKNEDRR